MLDTIVILLAFIFPFTVLAAVSEILWEQPWKRNFERWFLGKLVAFIVTLWLLFDSPTLFDALMLSALACVIVFSRSIGTHYGAAICPDKLGPDIYFIIGWLILLRVIITDLIYTPYL